MPSLFPFSQKQFCSRLAPTPSGYIHEGNALNFILTWLFVRSSAGILHLRIDDIDAERCKPEYVEDIFRSLDYLGLDYDAGPFSVAKFYADYSQQHRLGLYQELLEQLRLELPIYACKTSRRNLREQPGHWPYREAGLALSEEGVAWRLHCPSDLRVQLLDLELGTLQIALQNELGDPVLRQKMGRASYQVVSLYEDRQMQTSLFVRGRDLLPSSALQLYLASALAWQNFTESAFWHHALLTDGLGEKLSKSEGAEALRNWRAAGKSPGALYQKAAQLLGLSEYPDTKEDLLALFVEEFRGF